MKFSLKLSVFVKLISNVRKATLGETGQEDSTKRKDLFDEVGSSYNGSLVLLVVIFHPLCASGWPSNHTLRAKSTSKHHFLVLHFVTNGSVPEKTNHYPEEA